ncbi:putative laccase-11 [Hordeum vulgare]|nr:putative laccase-11 [Hordeum vulgare]
MDVSSEGGVYTLWCQSHSPFEARSGYLSWPASSNPIPSTSSLSMLQAQAHPPPLSRFDALLMHSSDAMVQTNIITYAMLTPEQRYQIEQEICARRASRIVAGLTSDSLEPMEEEEEQAEDEEREEQSPTLMEVADPKDAEEAKQEPMPCRGFDIRAEAEFVVVQAN